ncbi:glucose PTS transporter subunit IIA [Nesterenkonia sp. HG001]|uniref:glucose PTS transporter subunit IIA n=1 Tax=Nesterenkonia sp. HG001 TaxID=2983207 RepID=UPI002AC38E21|nr:glucose PTS transporter subunit IIA [Nesterenkonia sp. HG001]MDZ5076802.1 glucose PTS transporter subunit IIA [Nesterenkonia sp. HG001]
MSTTDHRALAEDILDGVGGADNVTSAAHCATRLRLVLRDPAAVRTETLKALPGVVTVVKAHGELHVVTGEGTDLVHQELELLTRRSVGSAPDLEFSTAVFSVRGLGGRTIAMLSAVFAPVIWPLAAAGLLKTAVVVLGQLGWLDPDAGTFTVLHAVSEGIFLFLPLFLAVTAARRFGAQPFTAMAVAAALVYPSLLDLGETQSTTTGPTGSLLGVPFPIMVFAASVIPILLIVLAQGWVERTLDRMLPASLRSVGTPLVTLLVVVFAALVLLGPTVVIAGEGLVAAVEGVLGSAPWLAGAVLGGLWHVLTILGLQWGMVGTIAESVGEETSGVPTTATLPAVIAAAVVAQAGAAIAVLLRTRSAARRKIAGAASVAGLVGGISEPMIYGVTLPLKKPFLFGMLGGAVGGALTASSGAAADQAVPPALAGAPAMAPHGSVVLLVIGLGVALLIGFLPTVLLVDREDPDEDPDAEPDPEPTTTSTMTSVAPAAPSSADRSSRAASPSAVEILAPMPGRLLPLDAMEDELFASGTMGAGVAIRPVNGHVVAPVSGVVIAAPTGGYAYGIRTDDGIDVLVHCGSHTPALKGEGFTPAVRRGDRVEVSQPLVDVDLELVHGVGFDAVTAVVVTNAEEFASVTPAEVTEVEPGELVMTVITGEKEDPDRAAQEHPGEGSEDVHT